MTGRQRLWNGAVVQEKRSEWSTSLRPLLKGVVISQTEREDIVVVRWEGGNAGEWEESIHALTVLEEKPVQDGTRAYSK